MSRGGHQYKRRWSNGKYIYEHREVAEAMLGRELLPDEEVHHINENKKDNRPENLLVLKIAQHSQITFKRRN
jgi:hypothetical protein